MPDAAASARRLHGGCLCGRVAYDVADEFRYAMYCHCFVCRRATGSAFKALAGIEAEKLALRAAEGDLLRFEASGWHDNRCGHCGSLLYAVVREGRFVHVGLGTLADDPGLRPSMHVFVASKAPWHEITDDLPRHDGAAPA